MGSRRTMLGFTLIELMVAVTISAIVMLFVFNIQIRMSESFTVQQRVSDLQYTLQTIHTMIDKEAKLAGASFPNGFRTNLPLVDIDGNGTGDFPMLTSASNTDPNKLIHGVQLVPGTAGDDTDSDTVFMYWGNQDRSGLVTACNPGGNGNAPTFTITNMTDANAFTPPGSTTPGEIVVIKLDLDDPDANDQTLPRAVTEACVGRVANRDNSNPNALVISFAPVPVGAQAACEFVCASHSNTAPRTQIYGLSGVGYRVTSVITNGVTEGVLQRNATGRTALPTTLTSEGWEDVALGIVDLQVALQYVTTNNDTGAVAIPPQYTMPDTTTVITGNLFPCPTPYEPCSGGAVGTHDLSRPGLVGGVPASTAAVLAQPTADGGGDRVPRALTFWIYAHSLKSIQGAVADGLVAASDRAREVTNDGDGFTNGAYKVSNNRAVRYLTWTSDMRNLGVDY